MISILLPCNKISDYLVEALRSLNQVDAHVALETVLVANNLDLQSVSKLEALGEEILGHPFQVINAGICSLSQALNIGIKACTYSLIARMDSDDIFTQERISAQWNFMVSHPDYALVGGAVERIDSHGTSLGVHFFPSSYTDILRAMDLGNCFSHPSVMFRREAILEVGGYTDLFPYAEDLDLFQRLSKGYKLANLETVVLKYRVHTGQVSSVYREKQTKSLRALMLRQWLDREYDIFDLPFHSSDHWVDKALERFDERTQLTWHNFRGEGVRRVFELRSLKAKSLLVVARSIHSNSSRDSLLAMRLVIFAFLTSPRVSLIFIVCLLSMNAQG